MKIHTIKAKSIKVYLTTFLISGPLSLRWGKTEINNIEEIEVDLGYEDKTVVYDLNDFRQKENTFFVDNIKLDDNLRDILFPTKESKYKVEVIENENY